MTRRQEPHPEDPAAPPAASVRHWLHAAAFTASPVPATLNSFSDGARSLDRVGRREVLCSLATDYDVPRARPGPHETVHERRLLRGGRLGWRGGGGGEGGCCSGVVPDGVGSPGPGGAPAPVLRVARGHEHAAGGLKLFANLLALLGEENAPALRALDSYMKEKLVTWLSPTVLTLHQITWDDPASLLEKDCGSASNQESDRLEEKIGCRSPVLWLLPSSNTRFANIFAQIGQAVYSVKETLEVAMVDNKIREFMLQVQSTTDRARTDPLDIAAVAADLKDDDRSGAIWIHSGLSSRVWAAQERRSGAIWIHSGLSSRVWAAQERLGAACR